MYAELMLIAVALVRGTAVATPIQQSPSATNTGINIPGAPAWPSAANAMSRRAGQLTNAERFERGLPPAKPMTLTRRSKGKSKLQARVNNAPSNAYTGSYRYYFARCIPYDTQSLNYFQQDGTQTTLTAISFQDAINQCAGLERTGGHNYDFFISQQGDNQYTCVYDTGSLYGQSADCDATNFAMYENSQH